MPQPTMPLFEEVDHVTAIRAGATAEAFVRVAFESYHQELYGFLRRTTRDDALAQDLVQESFLRLMREARAGRPPEQTRAWLYRVATNLTISRARLVRTVLAWLGRVASTHPQDTVTESPEVGVLRLERSIALESALGQIASDARTALILSGQGFTGADLNSKSIAVAASSSQRSCAVIARPPASRGSAAAGREPATSTSGWRPPS
ncbi:MAG TPA: RNA polymerase sigma factor, partial [Candidatus Limnocylindria bacterium]|nr:RNA polymerase sigma factor [Candidatus Limnocylindria bacterium]